MARKKLEIKVKYFDSEIPELKKIEVGDWIDLYNAEHINLLGNGQRLVPLGIGMILPDGYEAHVVPRSSTFAKWGLIQTNSMGVVDNSYSGDGDQWFWPVVAFERRLGRNIVPKGTPVAQFRIMKKMDADEDIVIKSVKKLKDKDRGGHGSTDGN